MRVIYRRLGLRGEAMVLLGIIWCLIGVGVVLGAACESGGLLHTLVPLPLRIAVWVVSGVFAVWAAFFGRTELALGVLAVAPIVRAVSYLWAWVMWLVPGGPVGVPTGWYAALFYFVMIGLVVLAAHIPAGASPPLSGGSQPREGA